MTASRSTIYCFIGFLFPPSPRGLPGPTNSGQSRHRTAAHTNASFCLPPRPPSAVPGIATAAAGSSRRCHSHGPGDPRPGVRRLGGVGRGGARQPPGALRVRGGGGAGCPLRDTRPGRRCAEVPPARRWGRIRLSCRPHTWERGEGKGVGTGPRCAEGIGRRRAGTGGNRQQQPRRRQEEAERLRERRRGAWSAAATPRRSRKRWKRGWTITATLPALTLLGKLQGKTGAVADRGRSLLPSKRSLFHLPLLSPKKINFLKSDPPAPTLERAKTETNKQQRCSSATEVPRQALLRGALRAPAFFPQPAAALPPLQSARSL